MVRHVEPNVIQAATKRRRGGSGTMRRLALAAALAATMWCLLAAIAPTGAAAATPYKDIASAGPLTHIYLGDELSCQIAHSADTFLEFFPPALIPGDCGTFVALGGSLYAPNFTAHGGTATGGLGIYTPFTPVSQSNVTGSGTAADPYKVVTVADAGLTGLRIQESDSYVVGDEAYRTDLAISNGSGGALSGVLYRAGDCFLGGSDFGFGFTEVFGNRKAVGCSVNANNTPPGRIEEWVPLTGGNNFYQARYSAVWSWIGTKAPFPDTCGCTTFQDNGGGISWAFTVPAGGLLTFSHVTTFSPTGKEPLPTSKGADSPTSPPGSQNGYTITISNPNPSDVTLNSITDTLPAGFSYVIGSTTGVTTSDPSVSGQALTWSGPFTVPANGSVSLHFLVTVATTPSTYFNEAGGGAAGGYTVVATGPTAPITIAATATADLAITKTASPDPAFVGDPITYTLTVTNNGPDMSSGGTVTDTLPANVSYVSDDDGCTHIAGTVTCPTGTLANGASQVIHIVVTATVTGSATNAACVRGNEVDNNSANDCASVTSQVIPKHADLSITKTGPAFAQSGGSITYQVAVGNAGPADATNVTVNDALPAGESLVSATPSQGSCAGAVTCNLGTILAGGSATVTIVVNVTAPSGATLTNTAAVSADQPDSNPGNNSSTTSTFVFSVSGGGNFVIGDHNDDVGSSVTFWGAQWWKLNSLSGGVASAAFKGFANTPASVTCGTNWSTRPGNSSSPPAGPLPMYMAVVVSGSIGRSGSTISGNTVHMVIVHTNPGYAPDPGHPGTGTVVAQIC
jgi:uncharacterized repeat protein (TIGR01451 family)